MLLSPEPDFKARLQKPVLLHRGEVVYTPAYIFPITFTIPNPKAPLIITPKKRVLASRSFSLCVSER